MDLRTVRFHKNLTQQELMLKTGIGQALLSAYERGVYVPTEERREKIAEALGIPKDELEFNEQRRAV